MKHINPYIYTVKKGRKWHSFFAVRLASVSVFVPAVESYKDYVFRLLNKQIDFINSLDRPEEDAAFELRFICRPERVLYTRGTIDVILMGMMMDRIKKTSIEKTEEIFHDVWSMLAGLSDYYEFECISERDHFMSVYNPFDIHSIVEIMRREDIVEIKTAKRLRGFGSAGSYEEDKNKIYFVYPFIWSANTLARAFNVMLFQDTPCFLSVSLKPVEFSDAIERFFEKQIDLCERYLATSAAGSSTLDARIEFITRTVQSQLLRLEDSPFLMKIRIAGEGEISRALIDSVGVEITEHAGSPDLIRDPNAAYVFSGGYDWYRFTGEEKDEEIENLKHMSFSCIAPTRAQEKDRLVRYLFDATQANCAFRLPVPLQSEFPGVETRFYKEVFPPPDIPAEGIVIGRNIIHGQSHYVRIADDDRRKHMYIVGQTGTGKSTLLLRMILQDIQRSKGVAVLDPHGELINEIMPRIPGSRVDDTIYVNFENIERPITLNMLEYRNDLEKDFVVNQMFEIFEKLYNMKEVAGPIFEQYMKNALHLIMDDPESGSTLLEVQKVFVEPEFRKYKLSKCKNRFVREFWEGIAHKATKEYSLASMAVYITSKLSTFLYNNTVRNIISAQKSSLDMRKIMDEGKILLVDLCKGSLGDIISHFLGMILVGKILNASLSRRDVKNKKTLKDFYLYVDEFQNLATDNFISILSEARKYRLNAILTNQYLTQIPPRIHEAIVGNVGTVMSFRVGMVDAEILEKEFYPVFTKFDLMNLPNWRAYISMLVDGEAVRPFSMQTLPEDSLKSSSIENEIKKRSGKRYGRRVSDIEEEITTRWNRSTRKNPDEGVKASLKGMDILDDEELVRLVKEEDSSEAFMELKKRYTPLIHSIGGEIFSCSDRIQRATKYDAIKEGESGLGIAIMNYDSSKGNFKAYARKCIRGVMINYLNDNKSHVKPLTLQRRLQKVKSAMKTLNKEGSEAGIEDIRKYLIEKYPEEISYWQRLLEKYIIEIQTEKNDLSLDDLVEEGRRTAHEIIGDSGRDIEREAMAWEALDMLSRILEKTWLKIAREGRCNRRTLEILYKYYVKGQPSNEIIQWIDESGLKGAVLFRQARSRGFRELCKEHEDLLKKMASELNDAFEQVLIRMDAEEFCQELKSFLEALADTGILAEVPDG